MPRAHPFVVHGSPGERTYGGITMFMGNHRAPEAWWRLTKAPRDRVQRRAAC